MRLHRSLLALLAAMLLVSGVVTPVRADEIWIHHLYIAGNYYTGGPITRMVGDHATIRVRPALEQMGMGVLWSPIDGSTIVLGSPESPAVLRPGEKVVRLKDRSLPLPIAPYIHEGRLYAPMQFFQALGIRTEWVSATKVIEMTPPPYSQQVGEFGPPGAGPATFSSLGKDSLGRLYLVVADGPRAGIWRSADHGATWNALNEGIGPVAAAKFIAGRNGELYLIPRGQKSIYRLDEAAGRWLPVERLQEYRMTTAAVAADGSLWYAAQGFVLDRNPPPEAPFPGGAVADLWLAGDGRLWAATTELGLYRLTGQRWEAVPWLPTDSRVSQIVSSLTDPRWMWAMVGGKLLASQDGGESWVETAPWGYAPEGTAEPRLVPGNGSELFLLTEANAVQYSPTGGGEWFRLTGYWPDAKVLDAAMDGDRLFLATTSGGVIIPQRIPQPQAKKLSRFAPRPTNWGPNLAEGQNGAGSLHLDPQQPDTAYASLAYEGHLRKYKTVDGGAHWNPLPLPWEQEPAWVGFFPHPTRSGHYGLTAPDGLWLTKDSGASWSHLAQEFRPGYSLANLNWLTSGRIVGSFEMRAGSRLVYTDDMKVLQDAENAPSWHITTILSNPAVPDKLYACDWHAEAPCHLSVDGATSWQPLVAQPPQEAGRPVPFFWSPAAPDELMAGRFVSRDSGRTWQAMEFFQEGDKILQIAVHPTNPQARAAVVETDGGHLVLVSRDGGKSWTTRGRPEGSLWVHAVAFDRNDRLWIGANTGIWRLGPQDW